MDKINFLIMQFLFLLRSFWSQLEQVVKLDKTGSLKDDWLQANWELIVEGPLREIDIITLEVYGDGADANGDSSRILEPYAIPTHAVYCYQKSGDTILDYLNNVRLKLPTGGLLLDKFVTLGNDGWYYEKPPFDKVLLENNKNEIVVDIKDLEFIVKKV